MTSYADWFGAAAQANTYALIDPPKIAAFQAYMKGDLSLDDAISCMTAPIQPSRAPCHDSRLLDMIESLALDNEESHDQLIALLGALFGRPKPINPVLQVDWSELKENGFRWELRHTYEVLRDTHDEVKLESDPVWKTWVNFHTFFARLLASGVYDAQYYSLGVTVSGLETNVENGHPSMKQEFDIRAASQWFIYAAKDILEIGFEEVAAAQPPVWSCDSQLRSPGEGFTRARWEFWRGRFGEFRALDGLSGETRELCRRAEVGMEKADRQGGQKKGRK